MKKSERRRIGKMAARKIASVAKRGASSRISRGGPRALWFHVDKQSVGIYSVPFTALASRRPFGSGGPIRQGRLGEGLVVRFEADVTSRVVPDDHALVQESPGSDGVLDSIKCSPRLAWGFFQAAMPGFWANRYRMTSDFAFLAEGTRGACEVAALRKRRVLHRRSLMEHAQSLHSKVWALRYHRANFRRAIDKAGSAGPGDKALFLITANAEFSAHDAATYSLLEELTRARALMLDLSRGEQSTLSFHQLFEKRMSLPDDGLRRALMASESWYPGFRQRRTNSTHAFGALVVHSNDLLVVNQLADRRLSDGGSPISGALAVSLFDPLVDGVSRLVEAFTAHLLTLFHPYDLVTLTLIDERKDPGPRRTTIFVRRIEFDEGLAGKGDVILDPSGRIEISTDLDGALSTPAPDPPR
ncbi:MAG: hypothetical protein IT370_11545 [Deltaproteobacteria bacterium]|nr:hypothetical protein [Deltaproteobacteria bacterium]